jgi:CBS domain-containing protein
MALIEQLMKTVLVTTGPAATIRDVAKQMDENGVGAVLVVTEGGTLSGLFSERDLLGRVVVPGLDPETTTVESVMTSDPVSVRPGENVRECAELIRKKGFRHLPVVQDGRAVGILSTRDFQQHVVQGLESFIEQSRYREALAEGQDPYDHVGGSYSR